MSGTYGQMKLQMTDIISQSKGTGKRKSRIDTGITEGWGHEKFMGIVLWTIEIYNSVFQPIPKKKNLSLIKYYQL